MRRPLPVFLFIVVALLLVSSLAGGVVNASTTQPTNGSDATGPLNRAPVSAERGEQIARDHLLANAASFGVGREDLASLRMSDNHADDFTGSRYVYFLQTVNGLDVYNAMMNVTILHTGEVLFVGNRGINDLAGRANSATPSLAAGEAVAAAADALGLSYTADSVTQIEDFGGADRAVVFSGGDLSQEAIPVKLVYMPVGGELRLSWDLNIFQQDSLHWWHVRVDANTGELLDKADWGNSENWDALLNHTADEGHSAVPGKIESVMTFADSIVSAKSPSVVGTYRVYEIPVESPSHTTPAPPADGRTLVANPDDSTASPFGWHDTNGVAGAEFTTTQGNNVHAYTDVDANNTPDAGSSPDGGAGLVFDFPLDLTQAPSAYRPAAVTNLFYWNNIIHDVSYLYGFDEASGNFQVNNYGNGGLGSDDVRAEAQDGSGTNNANFFTPADGQRPRMQMYIWTAPNPDRDGDVDNGIILHEYGHGVSNRLTGGPSNVSCLQNQEQMGEGWSDWQSVIYTMRPGDTATTNRGVGTYALNQPTTGVGIRPAPYNTNFAVNNYTYSNLPSMAVPHGVGFVWNTMLWEMNWELIAFHGWNPDIYDYTAITDGNTLAYKLVQDGMKIQPCSPGFEDGRDAILAADVALTNGANECRIWAAFARRGMGFSADQGSSGSRSDGTAAFDLPPQCTGGPTATPTVSPTPGTGTRVCSSTPIVIPDNLPGGATGTVTVTTAGNITDLNVILTGTHSWVGDIAANISNGSTNVTFFDRPGVPASTFGCSGDNLPGVVGDDEGAAGSFENSCQNATPAYTPGGHYTNNNPLTAFDGQPAAGTWTLTVSDGAGGDTGTITGWCVEFETGTGPTATPTVPAQVPDINVTPGAVSETHSSPPQTTNQVLTIQNVGTGTLNWTIAEDDTATTPVEDITDKVVPAAQDARLAAANNSVVQTRFLQSGAMAPSGGTINLVLDDGTNENGLGLTAGGQFIWFNRFTPAPSDFPFTLTEIQFYTGSDSLCAPTDAVDFYVYQDADGNPANGATHIGSLTGQTLGTLDQFNTYPTNINVTGPGDVLILAVNRGCAAAGQFPASLDQTASQVRSWIGFGGTPGNPPTLPATTMGTADSFGFPGNWLIRGVGQQGGGGACSAPTDIPWLTVSPTNGSTAGGGSTPVTLTFNSATLAQGTYTGTLCVESNDPDEELVTVPVTLNVGPPTAIDLSTFTAPVSGFNPADLAAAGLLLLAGAVLILRRK